MRIRSSFVVVLAGATALSLAGCGSSAKSAVPRGPGVDPAGSKLAGHSYSSTSVTYHVMPAGTKVTLRFGTDGRLSANAGCNTMGGTFGVESGRLVVGELAMTEMGCNPKARQDQDGWLAGLLRSGPEIVQSGKTLRVTQGQTTIELAET